MVNQKAGLLVDTCKCNDNAQPLVEQVVGNELVLYIGQDRTSNPIGAPSETTSFETSTDVVKQKIDEIRS